MSLRTRLLIGVAVVAVVLAGAAVFVTRSTEARLIEQVDAQLREADPPFGRGPFPRGGPSPDPDRFSSLYLGVVDGNRLRTVATPNVTSADPPLPELSAEQARQAEADEPFTVDSTSPDQRYRVVVRAERGRGSGALVLGLPLGDVDDTVDRLVAVQAGATVIALAVLGLVAWWVIRLGIRPVKAMTATATAIAGGDLSRRVPDGSRGTEAGELGRALNQMLGRIEDAFDQRTRSEQRLRRFVADASHELRTPVTTIRGYAELYRAGGLDDATELGEAMRRTEQEAVRMGSLVDDLLHLARLDQGRPLERQPVDLSVVVDDAVRDARAVDPERPISAVLDGPAMVTGDDGRLRQVVANLVGNALVHTPAGTPVEVRVTRGDGRVVLEVADQGPGMSEAVAARAFERFYRADPSRSRHHGGSGLGLSIVEATVRAHGGSASLSSRPGAGTTVRIELPSA